VGDIARNSHHRKRKNRHYSDAIEFPELVFATAGPIGVDMDLISSTLTDCLKQVGYASELIKISAEMMRVPAKAPSTSNAFNYKIDYANALRERFDRPELLASVGIEAIRSRRRAKTGDHKKPAPRVAYIVSQLKRPEEVELLRKVYGRQFVLVSAYASEVDRCHRLTHKLRTQEPTDISEAQLHFEAYSLMDRDASEEHKYGQRLRDTFHLGDVFTDGLDLKKMQTTLARFVQAFFGRNDISPTKDEYGMYAARSAALRSADLSRQIGAAICSTDGDIIVQGCNEVPRAHGGSYWDQEEPDYRDIKKGFDPNEERRREILRDVLERLRKGGFLSRKAIALGNDAAIAAALTSKMGDPGVLVDARLMDLTEYGRVVHAAAICDAARLGRSVKDAVLYCTAFPCHNCTKHILATGIRRVVYLEPYPKSQAKMLHGDEIEIESDAQPSKVAFLPFLGISHYRYRDIFSKGRRKNAAGIAERWHRGQPRPMLDIVYPSYSSNEAWALAPIIGEIQGLHPAETEVKDVSRRRSDSRGIKTIRRRRPRARG
jgi:deoxycytidylate deaminase